jgi:ADP-ribosylglycohydrolase
MKLTAKGQHAILGALVADAATMGFHWLYDQSRIRQLAPQAPEFRQPDAADYEGVPGYFAHPKKRAGDLSQYGEQAMVMLQCLADNNGQYEQAQYQAAFCSHFGYGGEYVGYIDKATRGTLNNVASAESQAMQQALDLPFDGGDDVKRRLLNKVLSCAKHASGADLRSQVEAAVRITDNTDENVAHTMKMVDIWESVSGYPGADDRQLPATAKLPALIACYAGSAELHAVAESAIRVTSHNDVAAAFGLAATDMIECAIQTGDMEQSVAAGKKSGNAKAGKLLDDALARRNESAEEATSHFGMACDLDFGLPSVAHNVITASGFEDAIRRNIYAGGDNCGRAIILGAIAGACYGVGGAAGIPQAWLDKTGVVDRAQSLIAQLS